AFQEIRPSPGDSAVAFVTHLELASVGDGGFQASVVPIDHSTAPVQVATHTGSGIDWTPDGRALIFFKPANDRGGSDDLQRGGLVEREAQTAKGSLQLAEKTRELARVAFHPRNRVRCLRDGRVLFDVAEMQLPEASDRKPSREQ